MPVKSFVLVTLDYPPETGGVARYLGDLVEAAAGAIRVIVPERHAMAGPGKVEEQPMFRTRWPAWWPMVGLFRHLDRTTEIAIISHIFPVGVAVFLARLMGGPAYILLFHGLDLKLATSFWKRMVLSLVCVGAKGIVVNSQATKRLLEQKKYFGHRQETYLMMPGISPRPLLTKKDARNLLGIDPEQFLVFSLARLIPRKGLDVAIEAVAICQKEQPMDYVIAGDGPDGSRLRQWAEEKGASVDWKQLDDAQKWVWLAACDVFCLPVRETADDMEGFGIVYLEAAIMARPSIAGNTGGAREAVIHQRTGLVVEPTTEAVARAIRWCIEHPKEAQQLGEQGRQRALQDFSWNQRWEQLQFIGQKD